LTFLSLSDDTIVDMHRTRQSFAPVLDAINAGPAGKSVLVAQEPSAGALTYLHFDGAQLTGSLPLTGDFAGFQPVPGSLAASQYYGTSF
jgi:hypothetical protein